MLAHGRWFSPGTPVSSTTKTGCHDIAEILLKVALSNTNQNQIKGTLYNYLLHMGWTSKVVVSPRIDNLMFTSSEGINCFYSQIFMTWMFCFAEDKKNISGIENTITEPDWKIRIVSKFSMKHKLSYYFYIVKHYVTYYNIYCL